MRTLFLALMLFMAIPAWAARPPAITTTVCPQGQTTIAYAGCSVLGKWGTKPYTFTISAGSLPTGLVLNTVNNVGIISGTPTVAATFSFKVLLTDSAGSPKTDDQQLYIKISATPVPPANPVVITTYSPLPDGLVNSAYTTTIQAIGGSGTYNWTVPSGALPAGLSLSTATAASGTITGTPTALGTSNFMVRATDTSTVPVSAQQSYFLNIANPTPAPTLIFEDGFENGCLTPSCTGTTSATTAPFFPAWTTASCGSGGYCPVNQTALKHSGNYAYSQNYAIPSATGTPSQDLNRWVGKVLTPALSTFASRAWMYQATPIVGSANLIQRKLLRFSDNGTLPGNQYDFALTSWTSSNGVIHPTYISPSFVSQSTHCPWTGTVNTSGTTVTRVSGALFNTNTNQANGSGPWANTAITINGTVYTISSVGSTGTLTLTASAGTQTAVGFTKAWVSYQIYDITTLPYNTWTMLEVDGTLNTPGVPDGVLKIYVNDVEVLNKSTVMYRGYGCSNDVNGYFFGAQANRYSQQDLDELRYFDDIAINDAHIGP